MRWVIGVLLGLGGCFIVPKAETTVTTSSQGVQTGRDRPGPVSLAVAASATVATVTATQAFTCHDDLRVVTEQRTHHHAGLYAVSGDGNVIYLWILFAPITIPISALVTAIELAGADDEVIQTPSVTPGAPYACAAPVQGLAVELVAGELVLATGSTDDRGSMAFQLPADLPGDAVVRAPALRQVVRVR